MSKDKLVASRKKKSISIRNIISTLLLIAALAMLFYPIVVNWLASQQNVKSVETYHQHVSEMSNAKVKRLMADAQEYNAKIYNEYIYDASQNITWSKPIPDYNKELAVDNTGIMGYISIPQIQIKDVPIYHGDSEKTLAKGIGHIQQTSLPIGGINTHAVLPAHSGRVNNTLFTELDKLKNGDVFYIHVLNKELKYRVVSEKIVTPKDTSSLGVVKGKDLVTLVTCWPTGINNKRLLVTGERTKLSQVTPQEKINRNQFGYNFWVMLASGLLALLALAILLSMLLNRRLYHAGFAALKEPQMSDSSAAGDKDFGPGFYLTNKRKVAEAWLKQMVKENQEMLAANPELSPVINVYRIRRMKDLSRWIFKAKSKNWQKYIDENADAQELDEKHELVAGPVQGLEYKFGKRTMQYVFKGPDAMKHLKYIKTIKKLKNK